MAVMLVLACGSPAVLAQTPPPETQFEITPFIGYQFGGDFVDRWGDDDVIDSDIDESPNYGLMVNIGVIHGFQIELLYSRQDSELVPDRWYDNPYARDITVEYYHAGGLYQWKFDKVVPYVAGSMGATRFDPDRLGSDTKFSWSAGGGVKLMFNPHVGLRLDGRFYSTYIDSGERAYYDDYWDEYYYYDDSTFLYQWNARAGLVIAF